ncbi:DNRLRE domain-containing protein [Streptomyces sp. NPDC087917]|uniref:DNRLRE domain-containing protein n=1 Tax=Streptomyces sp. NPDC087917 TaxID=3155060 RepID=UPI00344598A0
MYKNSRSGGREGGRSRRTVALALAAAATATGLVALAPAANAAPAGTPTGTTTGTSAATSTATGTSTAEAPATAVASTTVFGAVETWTRVARKHPNTGYWKSADALSVGQEGGSQGLSRSFLQLGTANLGAGQVAQATFRIANTGAGSCTAKPVELWSVDPFSANTTWNGQPAKRTKIATVTAAKGRPACAAGNLEFDVTALLKDAAATKRGSVTVGLYAADEGDTTAWKRFDAKAATLESTVTTPPTVSDPTTHPATACTGGLIGNTRISLSATAGGSAGGLTAEFRIFTEGGSGPLRTQSVSATRGASTTWSVPDEYLPDGRYTWDVRAVDEAGAASAWSPSCAFSVDRVRPSAPPVVSSVEYPNADQGQPEHTGTVRTPGTFTFADGGVEDLAEIVYWTYSDPRQRSVAPGAAAVLVPLRAGPETLQAYGVDKAGNRSDTTSYRFYVKRPAQPDAAGDLDGDGRRDLWTLAPDGRLQFRAGHGDGTFAAPTDGGVSLEPGSQLVTGGDWGEDGYNDLLVLTPRGSGAAPRLWSYPNTGLGGADALNRQELSVLDEANAHWADARQATSAGDIDGDGLSDLLIGEGGRLWLYTANGMGYLDWTAAPVEVGGADWTHTTVIAPGDTNGDGAADLWVRDDVGGDLFLVLGTAGADGRLDATSWGTAPRTKIGSGFTAAAYPHLGAAADLTGDAITDLSAVTADGRAVYFRGTTAGLDATPVVLG